MKGFLYPNQQTRLSSCKACCNTFDDGMTTSNSISNCIKGC